MSFKTETETDMTDVTLFDRTAQLASQMTGLDITHRAVTDQSQDNVKTHYTGQEVNMKRDNIVSIFNFGDCGDDGYEVGLNPEGKAFYDKFGGSVEKKIGTKYTGEKPEVTDNVAILKQAYAASVVESEMRKDEIDCYLDPDSLTNFNEDGEVELYFQYG